MGTISRCVVFVSLFMLGVASSHAQETTLKYGGVEIGSNGVRMVVLEFDPSSPLGGWKSTKVVSRKDLIPEYDNLTKEEKDAFKKESLQAGLVGTGLDQSTINLVAAHVEGFLEKMTDMPVENRFLVISSGVAANAKTPELQAQLQTVLDLFKDKVGRGEIVTARNEVQLAFSELTLAQSSEETQKTFLLDVGGGNTKFGGYVNDEFRVGEVVIGTATEDRTQEQIAAELRAEILRVGFDMNSYDRIILVGGAFWSMMGHAQPGDLVAPEKGDLRPVRVASINAYVDRAAKEHTNDASQSFEMDRSGLEGLNGEHLANAEKERSNSQRVISKEQRQKAAQIIPAIADVLELQRREDAGETILFPTEGHYAWPRAYARKMVPSQNLLADGKKLLEEKDSKIKELEAEIKRLTNGLPSSPPGTGELLKIAEKLTTLQTDLTALQKNQTQMASALSIEIGTVKKTVSEEIKAAIAVQSVDLADKVADSLKKTLEEHTNAVNKNTIAVVQAAKEEILKTHGTGPSPGPDGVPVTRDPQAAFRAFLRGREAFNHNSNAEALMLFDEAVRLDGNEPLFHYFRALTEHRQGMSKESQASAYRVAELLLRGQQGYSDLVRGLERVQGFERMTVERYVSNGTLSLRKTSHLRSLTQ